MGPLPRLDGARDYPKRFGPSTVGAVMFFILGNAAFGTMLAGLFWGILGWFLPSLVIDWLADKKKKRLQTLAKSFIATASGMYGANCMTPEVIRTCYERFPEPLASEFQNMLGMRNLNANATFPEMFRKLSIKYGLPEFDAVAAVIEAAEQSGGPPMTAKGLKRLNRALRERDRLLQKRMKSNYESLIASIAVLVILGGGLVLDATVFRHLFQEGVGKFVLAISSGLVVAMFIVTVKTTGSKDLI